MVVQNQEQMGEGLAQPTDTHPPPTFDTQPPQPKKTQKPKKPKRKTTKVPQPSGSTDIVVDEAVLKEGGDSLVRATTTPSSLEAEQGSGNIAKTQTKVTPNKPSSLGTSLCCGPRCKKTMRDTLAHTRYERVSKISNDSLLARGNTLRSDEESMKLQELMDICTTLTQRVLDLETELKETKTTHKAEVADLRKRVKKLEKKNMSRTHKLKRLYKGRIADIVDNEEITLVSTTHDDVDEHVDDTVVDNIVEDVIEEEVVEDIITAKLIVDVSTAGDQEVSAVNVPVSAVAPIITTAQPTKATKTVEITTAPKVRGISIQEQEESTTKTASSQQPQVQDKRKGKTIMIEEPEMPKKRKVQERLDKEYAKKLQAEIDEEDRLEREKSQHKVESNEALINTWDDI
ncbi:hypothetical protein Tco_0848866 [Tanacetum coccineum]